MENKEKKWNRRENISKGLDIFIHLIGYTLVLIAVSVIFKKIVFISNVWFGFLAVLIIFILKLADWILGPHFDVNGILWLIVVSIVISIMNAIMDNCIIDGILKGGKKK